MHNRQFGIPSESWTSSTSEWTSTWTPFNWVTSVISAWLGCFDCYCYRESLYSYSRMSEPTLCLETWAISSKLVLQRQTPKNSMPKKDKKGGSIVNTLSLRWIMLIIIRLIFAFAFPRVMSCFMPSGSSCSISRHDRPSWKPMEMQDNRQEANPRETSKMFLIRFPTCEFGFAICNSDAASHACRCHIVYNTKMQAYVWIRHL